MTKLTRRKLLYNGLAMGSAVAATRCAAPKGTPDNPARGPEINTNQIKDVTLRFIGIGVSQINEIRDKAQEDLGFKIVRLGALSNDEIGQIALTESTLYDIFEGQYWNLPQIIPSGNLQPIEVAKIKDWDKIVPLFTTGKFEGLPVETAQGKAPYKVMYLTGANSRTFSATPTDFATLIPFQYNADTLGYRPDLVGRSIESWGDLFNEEFRGRTSIKNSPQIGIMDVAMAAEALGLMTFGDKGNMTKGEIDQIIDILKEQKAKGQFRAFWRTFNESVNLMVTGEVVLQSMWILAANAVRSQRIECIYAPLKEGYRGWGGGIGLSRSLSGIELDAAYEYMNWSLEGWLGAFLGRQGYYSAVPENARKYISPEEWDFWYEGKPAAIDIVDPFGQTLAKAGAVRDGGSFRERFGNIVCWNSAMEKRTYLTYRWNEFIAS